MRIVSALPLDQEKKIGKLAVRIGSQFGIEEGFDEQIDEIVSEDGRGEADGADYLISQMGYGREWSCVRGDIR